MRKHRIERNLAFPTEEFRRRVRSAAKERGFRTEQAFILAACENEIKRGDAAEATEGEAPEAAGEAPEAAGEAPDAGLEAVPEAAADADNDADNGDETPE